jgi:hypothetical protein
MERRVDGLEDNREHHRKSAVDEGTVDDYVYLVEAILKMAMPMGDRRDLRSQPPTARTDLPDPPPLQGFGAGVHRIAPARSTAPA